MLEKKTFVFTNRFRPSVFYGILKALVIYCNFSLFIDEVKNTADVTRHLQCDDEMKSVKVLPYHHFDKHLSAMVESKSKIWVIKQVM